MKRSVLNTYYKNSLQESFVHQAQETTESDVIENTKLSPYEMLKAMSLSGGPQNRMGQGRHLLVLLPPKDPYTDWYSESPHLGWYYNMNSHNEMSYGKDSNVFAFRETGGRNSIHNGGLLLVVLTEVFWSEVQQDLMFVFRYLNRSDGDRYTPHITVHGQIDFKNPDKVVISYEELEGDWNGPKILEWCVERAVKNRNVKMDW